jgi:hypothetical protein
MQEQPTGTDIWLLVDGQRSLEDIAAELSSRYGTPLEDARQTVLDFVAKLLEAGIVAKASPEGPVAGRPPSER